MSIDNELKKPPKLTVVVIAYNNELYIEEALQSLYEQTFDDFEVVVVNDHSSDKTGEIIDEFVKGKPNFKAIHLEKNSGGCSVPRNTGIANSSGEYLMFLDGDDWYTVDACEKMVAAIERTDSDFVAGQAIRTNNYQIWYYRQIYSQERININIREFKYLLFDSLSVNKIYKRSFLEKHNLRFPEGIHYEDVVFTGKAYFLAESVSIIPEPIYYWRVVENAKVKSISNRRFEFENFENRIIAHRFYDEFLRNNGFSLYQGDKNNRFLRHDLKLYTNDYLLFDEDYKEKFHKLIFEYLHEVMDEYAFINLPEKDRIMCYLLYLGDQEAFQDYIYYINGMPTSTNRVYSIGNTYYFRSSKVNPKKIKLLRMNEVQIDFNLYDIKLSQDKFSFSANVDFLSVDNSDIQYYWRLKNSVTKDELFSSVLNNGRVEFSLRNMNPGNHYLSLFVIHQGNVHKRLVKKTNINNLPNLKVVSDHFSKAIYVNKKNSVAIQVSPQKAIDKIRWQIERRKRLKSYSKENTLNKAIANFLKGKFKQMPVRKNWIIFESHMGKQYSDSPKYIYEELLKSKRNFKFIWSLEDPDSVNIPGPAIKVKRNSTKHLYYLNRAKYWIDNQGIAHLTPKKDNQIYIQTWHGTPLKKMGYDQKSLPSETELNRLKIQTKAWDYFVSPNKYSTEIFRRAFRYGGEIIETGYPRNDILFNKSEDLIMKVKSHFNIPDDKKVVLYSPTFRDWDPNSYQKVINDIQKLSQQLDENIVILLRLHYLLAKKMEEIILPSNIINASEYDDIQELYLISDIMITDYSSAMFDYALLKRPIILYCYDLKEYVTRRGTYFDLVEKAPGPVCFDIEEVISFLNHSERLNGYKEALDLFVEEFGKIEDGKAAERVIQHVFK